MFVWSSNVLMMSCMGSERAANVSLSYQVREVTNFTEPAQAGGQTVSTASYTYSAAEIAGWAQGSEILRGASRRLARDLASGSEPIKGQAVLVLTENGWMHAAMFGK